MKDYLTHRQGQHLACLAPGDSAIVQAEGESFAAYRSPQGELFAVSPVCTHLGCKVHWNSVEKPAGAVPATAAGSGWTAP